MSNSQSSGAGGDGAPSPYADLYKDKLSSIPNNLLKLELVLDGPSHDVRREDPDLPPFTNLQNCIDAQTQLQEVYFCFCNFPVNWTVDAFTSLANSCGRTLRYLELQGFPNSAGSGVLDLEMLSVCESLEVLHLPVWGRTCMTFRNVEKLPISLKRLVICLAGEGGQVLVEDPDVFKRLRALEWLYLSLIKFPSAPKYRNMESQLQFHQTMVRGLLSLRKLEGFYFETNLIGLNWDRSTVKMLRPFYEHIDPARRAPQYIISFNLKWRTYDWRSAQWSDRPFDKEATAKPQPLTGLGKTNEEMDANEAGETAKEVDEVADMEEDLEEMDEEDKNSSDED